MAYSIDYINLICTDLGGTGGHAYEIDGMNEICTLIGATAGHSYNIDALNAICTALGYTAGHEYNIDALNAIYVDGAYVYEDDAWQAIQVGSLLNPFVPKYFVDAINGDDTNDGLTKDTAYKTISKVNSKIFVAGDVIAFKSGQTHDGQLNVNYSGSEGLPIVYTYYGVGAKPIITQSTTTSTVIANSKSYFTLYGLDIRTTSASGISGIRILGSAGTGITIKKCIISALSYAINCNQPINGLELDDVTAYNTTAQAIYFYGSGSSNFSIKNIKTYQSGGALFRYITNLSVENSQFVCSISNLNSLEIRDCLGSLNVKNVKTYSTASFSYGTYINNSTFTSGGIYDCYSNSTKGAGFEFSNISGITVSKCLSYQSSAGFQCNNATFDVSFYGCYAFQCTGDGFITTNAHDITFLYCRSSHCGLKTTTSDGDGFTSHLNDYNINCYYCIADYNTASGWCMVGNSQGLIYNCIAYKNAGNWVSEGGLDQVRGGFTFYIDGNNPTTGTTWIIKNSISDRNYPRELYVDRRFANIELDHNQYKAISDLIFASIDAGSDIDWDTYHATYEANSVYADPFIASDNDLYPTTKISIGENLGNDLINGLDISTIWNSISASIIVTKQQSETWQIGPYIQN